MLGEDHASSLTRVDPQVLIEQGLGSDSVEVQVHPLLVSIQQLKVNKCRAPSNLLRAFSAHSYSAHSYSHPAIPHRAIPNTSAHNYSAHFKLFRTQLSAHSYTTYSYSKHKHLCTQLFRTHST